MTDQQQETSPMSDLITFPGSHRRATPGATVTATAERLPEPEAIETDAEVIDFPAPRPAEPDSAVPAPDDEDEPEADGELAVRPDTVPARRRPSVPPALAGTARRAGQITARASMATARGTARAGVATARGTARAAVWSAPHAKTGSVFVVRHSSYCVGGGGQMVRMVWRRIAHSELDDAIRAARGANDLELVARLQHEKNQSANDRWKRLVTQLKVSGIAAAVTSSLWCVTTVAMAIWGGIAELVPGGSDWASLWTNGWWGLNTGAADLLMWAASWWAWVAGIAVLAGLVTAWVLGRNQQTAPRFAQAGVNAPTQAVTIDETAIAQALGGLGISAINDYFKQGLALQYTVMPHRTTNEDGDKDIGVSAQVRLPGGASTEEVIKKSKKLAANLARASVEVWPSVGEDEGLLNLWVADRGSLEGSLGAWPWLERVEAIDLYAGVPIGRTLDGRLIVAPVDGASYLVGGKPGQGKSQFVRTLVAGALLDPRARIRVHVLANNNDFAPMKPRLETYRTGLGREVVESVLAEMEELYAELERRGKYMEEHGYDTAADAGFEPIVSVFDEIHTAFQFRDKKLREEIAAYAEDLSKLARKYGILVIYSTQSADAASIPKGVTRQSQQRIAYAVTDQPANDGLLGSGSYRQGITATSLRPGNESYHGDRGKSVTVGLVPEADWAMCQGYYIGSSALPGLVAHAQELQTAAGTETTQAPAAAPEQRDLLEDLDQALNSEPVPAADVPALLRDVSERWYRNLSGKELRSQLAALGYRVPSTNNRFPVDPARVRELLAQQATQDLDGDE